MKKRTIIYYILILVAILLIYYSFSPESNSEIKNYIDVIEQDKVVT